MPRVWIPAMLRSLTGEDDIVQVSGKTIGEVIDNLNRQCPGVRDRLCDGNSLRSGLAAVVGSEVARLGLSEPVAENSEIHFVQAIGGG